MKGCKPDCSGPNDGFNCISVAPGPSTCTTICNDLFKVIGEGCDDGPNSDKCLPDCSAHKPGFECQDQLYPQNNKCFAICGDDKILDGEDCDDGN